jgi:hypothetical protein
MSDRDWTPSTGESPIAICVFFGLHDRRGANFVIGEHQSMPTSLLEPLQQVVCSETGNCLSKRFVRAIARQTKVGEEAIRDKFN